MVWKWTEPAPRLRFIARPVDFPLEHAAEMVRGWEGLHIFSGNVRFGIYSPSPHAPDPPPQN